MTTRLSILIVDDDVSFAASLAEVAASAGMTSHVETNAIGAMGAARRSHFDCAIVDYMLGAVRGTELIREMRGSGCPTIILTAFGDIPTAVHAMREGAYDFLEKPVEPRALLAAIEGAAKAAVAISDVADRTAFSRQLMNELTYRERQIVDALVAGRTSRSISTELAISLRTVEAHRANILKKLGLSNTAALVRIAVLSNMPGPAERGN